MLTGRKKALFYGIYFTLFLLFFIPAAEILARITGHKAWAVKPAAISVEPGGRFYQNDPRLGYKLLPGQFKVTLEGSYVFRVTNLKDTLRATHSVNGARANPSERQIWIFGDSVTYGWSVNDEETFPWLLQQDLRDYEIVNFGVNGYGTLHSLIQLRDALQERNKPGLVVLTYASWQDVRNTFVRGRRKMLAVASSLGPVNQPYARLTGDEQLNISMDSLTYREFPLMRYSAFMNMVEEIYDRYEERHTDSHQVSKAIVKEFALLCRSNGVDLIVSTLTSDPTTSDMLEYCQAEGIKTADMHVDVSIKENNNLPFDSHPSASAQKQYAQKLEPSLLRILPGTVADRRR